MGKPVSDNLESIQQLLKKIRDLESTDNYNASFSSPRNGIPGLTEMTIDEVLKLQDEQIKKGAKSSAIGAYQFLRKVLLEEKEKAGLSGTELFTAELQDFLIKNRLSRFRNLDGYLSGDIDELTFSKNLSKEFASFPNPDTGASYYDGDGLNKSLTTPDEVFSLLRNVKEQSQPKESKNLLNEKSLILEQDFNTKQTLINNNERYQAQTLINNNERYQAQPVQDNTNIQQRQVPSELNFNSKPSLDSLLSNKTTPNLFKYGGNMYPNGGQIDPKQKKPLYVDSEQHPRYKSYQDSLDLSNTQKQILSEYNKTRRPGYEFTPDKTPLSELSSDEKVLYFQNPELKKLRQKQDEIVKRTGYKPIGQQIYTDEKMVNEYNAPGMFKSLKATFKPRVEPTLKDVYSFTDDVYKKPEQEVIVDKSKSNNKPISEKSPIYVDSKNDPRYIAYKDSLVHYNYNKQIPKTYKGNKGKIRELNILDKASDIGRNIKAVSMVEFPDNTPTKGGGINRSMNYPLFKKPEQPVILKNREPNLDTDVVAYLQSQEQPHSYTERKRIFNERFPNEDYKGNADQNIKLLQSIKTGNVPKTQTEIKSEPKSEIPQGRIQYGYRDNTGAFKRYDLTQDGRSIKAFEEAKSQPGFRIINQDNLTSQSGNQLAFGGFLNQNQFPNGGGLNKPLTTNSPEYAHYYNEGNIVGKGEGENNYISSLPPMTLFSKGGDYPYYKSLSEQELKYFNDKGPMGRAVRAKATSGRTPNANDAAGMAGNLLGATGSVLQTPQSMMVEGIEGMRGNEYSFRNAIPHTNKQRLPSDAWGYENPEGFWQNAANIGMDIVADPSLVTGGGAMSRIPTSSGVINKLARKTVKEVGEKAVKKGINKTKDIPLKVKNLPDGISSDEIKNIVDREIKWLNSDAYKMRKMRTTGMTKDQVENETDKILKKLNHTTLDFLEERPTWALGTYRSGNKPKINIFNDASDYQKLKTVDHEYKHALSEAAFSPDRISSRIAYKDYPKENFKKLKDYVIPGQSHREYLSDASEQQVRLRQIMQHLEDNQGLPMGEKANISHLNKIIDEGGLGLNEDARQLFRMYREKYSDEEFLPKLLKQLNKAYVTTGIIGAGAATQSEKKPNQLKLGGSLTNQNTMNEINMFNEGGSHEANPLGGIPQGMGQNDQMNTVEEGEGRMGDMVYSDRIPLTEEAVMAVGLPKKFVGKTPAQALAEIDKIFKDRGDKAAQETKEDFADKIAQAQEMIKEQQAQIDQAMAANSQEIPDQMGGQIPQGMEEFMQPEQGGLPMEQQDGRLQTGMQEQPQMFRNGGRLNRYFGGGPIDVNMQSEDMSGIDFGQGGAPGMNSMLGAASTALDFGNQIFGKSGVDTSGKTDYQERFKSGAGIVSNSLKGAAAGTAIMPGIGTAIGAGVGAITGIIGGNKKRKDLVTAERNNALVDNAQMRSDFAYGGKINKFSGGGDKNKSYYPEIDNPTISSDSSLPLKNIQMTSEKMGNLKPNLLNKVGDWYQNNQKQIGRTGNALLRGAPVGMNLLQLKNAGKYDTVNAIKNTKRFNPQYIDEKSLQNIADQSMNKTINSVSEMGGSRGQMISNIKDIGKNRAETLGKSYLDSRYKNIQTDTFAQQFDNQNTEANIARQIGAEDRTAMNKGAAATNKSRLLSQIGNDLGNIGRENMYKEIAKITGYGWLGNFIKQNPNASKEELIAEAQKYTGGGQSTTEEPINNAYGGKLKLKRY